MSNEYVKRSEIIETRWKCPSCGADNRGRDMKCPACGAPKDESAVYEVDANAAAVTDADAIADAKAGEHWVCAFCEKENRGRKTVCQFCNADQTTRARKPKPGAGPKAEKPKQSPLVGCLIVIGFTVALVALLVWIVSPKQVDGTVASLSWTQSLHVMQKTLVSEEAWKDALPASATEVSCQDKYRRDQQVLDHYRTVTKTRSVRYQSGSREECSTSTVDLGNGYAERKETCRQVPEYDYRDESYTDQEPVYRTEKVYEPFCSYRVFRWPIVKSAKRTGTDPGTLEWPVESELGVSGCTPCQVSGEGYATDRCCAKVGTYKVTFTDPDDPESKPVLDLHREEDFKPFAIGQVHRIEVTEGKASLVKDD